MKLSKTGALAVLATRYLTQQNGKTVRARNVGEALNIPTDSALKILQALARGRVIDSHLGRSGGYSTQRTEQQITLLEVIEAIDGPISGGLALDGRQPDDLDQPIEQLQRVCRRMAEQVREQVARTTLAELDRITATPTRRHPLAESKQEQLVAV